MHGASTSSLRTATTISTLERKWFQFVKRCVKSIQDMLLVLILLKLIAVLYALWRVRLELVLDEADDAQFVPFSKLVTHSSQLFLFLEL